MVSVDSPDVGMNAESNRQVSSLDPLEKLRESVREERTILLSHPIYGSVRTIEDMRIFMQHHVFAVWDFMCLAKALQQSLSCVSVPWIPSPHVRSCRLINEIVLAEESDEDQDGGYASHFELYRRAMRQCAADHSVVDAFVDKLAAGTELRDALASVAAPDSALEFVQVNWSIVESRSLPALVAAFALGREVVIPDMFSAIVAGMDNRFSGQFGLFLRYLNRHISLDGEEHSVMALDMLREVCGDEPQRWKAAEIGVRQAYTARIALWDGTLAKIQQAHPHRVRGGV